MATRKKHYCTDVLSYPVISKENKGSKPGSTGFWRIYEYLFHEGSWLQLEQDLATALTELHCPLATILNVGDVSVPQRVHSTFSCPILKTQSTESNPPMRLSCGHVISSDALHKLAAQSRNQRFKCPYCPEESNLQEATRVYF
uniref:RING-Gid-type domain-containing protein n=1 Tax=Ditylenchus dipsaci TaxID=166011 RepID=A0A915E789_9BILA